MMNFFKNLFKKKEEEVKIEELGNWFEKNIDDGAKGIREDLMIIKSIKEELHQNLKELAKVEIKEEAQKKIKDTIMGNVPAYVRAVEIFLEKIIIPNEINSENLILFYGTLQRELDQFGKKTARNFAIMQTLIGKELAITARNIKRIDETSKSIRKKTERLKKIEDIKGNIDKIGKLKKNKEEQENRKLEYEKEKQEITKEKEQAEKDMRILETSNEAKELARLRKCIEDLEIRKKEVENELLSLFSPLQKAFKRYNNMFYIKKVEDYINNAAETLKQDEELEVIKYLKDIKKMVEEEKIGLKEDKKKKALTSLEKLDERYLKNFIKEQEEFNREKEKIEEKIKTNKYQEKKEELDRKIREKDTRVLNIDKELIKIKDLNTKKQVEITENELKELGYEVKIHAVD